MKIDKVLDTDNYGILNRRYNWNSIQMNDNVPSNFMYAHVTGETRVHTVDPVKIDPSKWPKTGREERDWSAL